MSRHRRARVTRCSPPRRDRERARRSARDGIDHRLWYGRGLHREPYFATDYSLPVVDALASRLIGLPVAPDLSDAAIERIVATLARALA
jgi:dTDP-4-amino-4,6-dideoxygalactose transaminase